jgi:hypothetical protein
MTKPFASVLALTLSSLALVACTSGPSAKTPHYEPPSEVAGDPARCDSFCDMKARGQTLDQLCDAIVGQTKDKFAQAPTCKAENPIGIWIDDSAAVHDVAIVNVTSKVDGDETRYALLALSTDRGWELAYEIGSVKGADTKAWKVTTARAADVPGLAPFGVEVHVRMGDEGGHERVFVCGVGGSKDVSCPVAVQTS